MIESTCGAPNSIMQHGLFIPAPERQSASISESSASVRHNSSSTPRTLLPTSYPECSSAIGLKSIRKREISPCNAKSLKRASVYVKKLERLCVSKSKWEFRRWHNMRVDIESINIVGILWRVTLVASMTYREGPGERKKDPEQTKAKNGKSKDAKSKKNEKKKKKKKRQVNHIWPFMSTLRKAWALEDSNRGPAFPVRK